MPTPSSCNASSSSSLPPFSHLYIETAVEAHPLTEELKQRLPKAKVVPIDRYTELTQKRSVTWSYQKRTPKIILARNQAELIYPCSDVAPNFGHENFYYAVPMQNCLYDCEYCYLQGMYNSAHLVVFVNQDAMQAAAQRKAEELGSLYLCIAYDNDLLAFEGILGLVGSWVQALRDTPSVTVEVRTKSANFRSLKTVEPASNFILAWTLSPMSVTRRFEAKTPDLESRLKAMSQAMEAGWRVRLCLDPLLPVREWKVQYGELLERLDQAGLWAGIEDVSFGAFRMNKDYLRKARKARPDSALLHSANSKEARGLFTIEGSQDLLDYMSSQLQQRMPAEKVWLT